MRGQQEGCPSPGGGKCVASRSETRARRRDVQRQQGEVTSLGGRCVAKKEEEVSPWGGYIPRK